VRELDDLPGAAVVTESTANREQLAAIEEPGVVFVSAGAGTGKTTVLVERYAKAVVDRGLSVDSVLVITYTERAAGELRERIRKRLRELARDDLAGELERAWISTIHGFCSRLLRAHPFEAGLDPRFRVLDEGQASVLRGEAFATALAEFCADRQPDRLRLLAAYGARSLRTMLVGVFERLRTAGRPLSLELGPDGDLESRLADARTACEELLAAGPDAEIAAELERLLALMRPDEAPERLRELPFPSGAGDGDLSEAVDAVRVAALERIAARDRDLLQELLSAFAGAYRRAKEHESALDFEDLQLLVRDLLREHPSVRTDVRLRFRSVMVDEFQDTNRLQCELIDLISADADGGGADGGDGPIAPAADLFFVGDEFQSIYRFRHADVDVFRERRAASGGVLALTRNYRSRPEVLGVVNHLFSSEFGEEFAPLEAGGRFPDPVFEPAVELLVTDKSSYRDSHLTWRAGEARHVAARVRELVDSGESTPGEVVLLFAAGTGAEAYEEALREQGLPTYRAAGRGYFGQQQTVDLLAYLRLLQNRYDDEALLTVLASPLVGVSNDALVLLRRAAGRRPLFAGLETELPAGLSDRDRRWLAAFRQRYERLIRLSLAVGLERLCERIVAEHDYDLAVLAHWDGRRRYANLRKLARLARSFEELRGPDLEGFVRFVRDQESAGAREGEAVAAEEGADAVRLLTIHAAKGLEFKVVVVCDAGRTGAPAQPDEILCLPDGRFGFRVADPATGQRVPVFEYDDVREAERAAAEAETRRLYYVAMTRAIDRLIVSGAVDPTRRAAVSTPIGWVIERLGPDLSEVGPVEVACGDGRVIVRVDRAAPAPPAPPVSAEQLPLFESVERAAETVAFELAPLTPIPSPPAIPLVRRLSYSALALYSRCSYRFFAERVVGLAPDEQRGRDGEAGGLLATEIGDAVHALLETPPGTPEEVRAGETEDLAAFLARRYPSVGPEDADRVASLVAAWWGSPLAARLGGLPGVRHELPFAFEHDGVLLHGRFDVFWRQGPEALVVDYKTNRLDDDSPGEVVDREYGLQRLVYALAALRAGVEEVEVTFVFLERPADVVSARFGHEDAVTLEAELSAAIAAVQAGDFRPNPSEWACSGCPALDRICAGPRLSSGIPAGLDAELVAPAPS
jgi:ATP-dependent exoDNAse (exonuclease V) beta subunit